MLNNGQIKNRTIFIRDNLEVMRGMDSGSIDLIYLDPPFKKNDTFVIKDRTKSKIQAIKDYFVSQQKPPLGWHKGVDFEAIFKDERVGFSDKWNGHPPKGSDDVWHETDINVGWQVYLAKRDKRIMDYISSIRKTASGGMYYYLTFMAVRLLEMHRLLKETGSLYLHCDPTASHYLKGLLDVVFGNKNHRNEIVWCYPPGGKNPKDAFHRKHDVIFYYSKGAHPFFKNQYKDLSEAQKYKFSKTDPEGNKYKEYRGTTRTYLKDLEGSPVPDWWVDIPSLGQTISNEKIGYPTQKPVKLMERIIQTSSREGDIVLDPFCGCATTLVAAQKLFRNWIGIDKNPQAYWLLKYRFEERKETAVSEKLMQHDTERGYTKEQQEQREQLVLRTAAPTRTDGGEQVPPAEDDVPLGAFRTQRKSRLTKQDKEIAKELFYEAQNGICNGCLTCKEAGDMHLDHIVPISKDGTDDLDNLQLLCGRCNTTKSGGTMLDLVHRLQARGHLKEFEYDLQRKRYGSLDFVRD